MASLTKALGSLMAGLGSIVGIHPEERPPYRLLAQQGPFEVRQYDRMLLATTQGSRSLNKGQGDSFRILAGYIFGGNRARTMIPMTAPVVQQPQPGEQLSMTAPVISQTASGSWSMAFVLPASLSLETAPEPLDPRVELQEVPAAVIAIARFGGWANEAAVLRQERRLRDWLAGQPAFRITGPCRLAQYDPPYTLPPFRHNEVMIPVEGVHPEGG